MKKFTLILALLITGSVLLELSAQTLEIDSLENLLHQHQKKDTVRVNLLNKTATKLCRINLDKALKYAEESGELADKLNFTKGKATSLYLFGLYNHFKSNFPEAIVNYEKAIKKAEEIGDKKRIADCSNNIGIIHKKLSNYPQALEALKKSLELNEDIGDKKGISGCLNNMGTIYFDLGDYHKAIEYLQRSLKIKEEIGDKRRIASSLNNIGMIHGAHGNHPMALEFYQKALKIYEVLDDKNGIAVGLNNIGNIQKSQGNFSKALENYKESLIIKEEIGDKKGIISCLRNMGSIQWELKNFPLSLEYFKKSLKIAEEIGSKNRIAGGLISIGSIHQLNGDYSKALDYFQKSLKIREKIGDKRGICESYEYIGEVYLKTNNYTKALDYTLKSLAIANKLELLNAQKNVHEQLSLIYEATKNYKKALESYVLFKELNDSIFNEKNIKKITGLEYQYKYEKEKQATELEQQKKDAVYAEEAKRQKTMRNSFIAGFILMVLLVLVVLRSFLQKRKANHILDAQKTEIEEKNTELLHKNEEILTQAEELKTTNEELYELNVTKDKLFSVIAHDLKNPFSSIIGFVDLLIERYDDYNPIEIKEMLYTIQNSSNNAFKLLENLLDWSSSQIDGIKFDPKRISLNKLVKNNFKLLENTAKSKDIKLINQTSDNIKIYADENMLNAVIQNLLSNAVKFTGKGGKVNISTSSKKGYVEVIIADNGIGISKEDISKLFRIDVSFSTIGTAQEKGTGLGLILCKEFIEKHGGEIWVESEVGKGSKFIFTIKSSN